MRSLATKKNTMAFLKYAVVFFVSILIIFLITVTSCLIPRNWIKDNTIKSLNETAEVIRKSSMPTAYSRFEVHGDIRNYAMIYYTDNSDPIRSAVEMNYDGRCEHVYMCVKLMDNDSIDKDKMVSYNRYWQGQSVMLHFLTIFGSFLSIRTFVTILFIILSAFTIYKIYKEDKALAASFFIGLSSINVVFMTRSLEFIPVMFVMMIAILLVLKMRKSDEKKLGFLFLVLGVLTCYLDFLTCETVVLSAPLIIYTYLNIKEGKKVSYKNLLFLVLMWGIGYAGAFLVKWILSYLFMGDKAIKSIVGNMTGHRLKGSLLKKMVSPITLSFSKLLPFALLGKHGGIFAIIIFVVCLIFTVKKNKKYLPLFIICLVPVFRFCVVNSHSILLNYFTYRALLCVMIVMSLTIIEMIKRKVVAKSKKKN